MLKIIKYFGNLPEFDGKVVYFLDRTKKICIFSGITHKTTSTINAAEGIIAAIALEEVIPIRILNDMTFNDLMTNHGYSGRFGRPLPQMKKLSFTVNNKKWSDYYYYALSDRKLYRKVFENLEWDGVEQIPEEIKEIFKLYID